MAYEFKWENRGVVARFWGTTNSLEALDMLNTLGNDHRFDSLIWRINDYLDAKLDEARSSELNYIDALNNVLPLTNPRVITAIAVQEKGIAALVRKLLETHPCPDNVAMFDSMEGARAWIEMKRKSNALPIFAKRSGMRLSCQSGG